MIIEQHAPAGVTAWLAAVGLAHLTLDVPDDPVALHETLRAGPLLSRPSRWVNVGSTWHLEIDQPAGWDDIVAWYAHRFGGAERVPVWFGGRDPWWRTRGNTNPQALGEALYREIVALGGRDLDVVAELRSPASAVRTSALAGWVIDRQWVTLETDQAQIKRPLVRYALAYIGATVAQDWPGHMVGTMAVGHLWDGQPSDHPLEAHQVIVWEPVEQHGVARYPDFWGPGRYVDMPRAEWASAVRDFYLHRWLRHEIVGERTARRLASTELPPTHLDVAGTPLWRRSFLADEVEPVALSGTRRRAYSGDLPLDMAAAADHAGLSLAVVRGRISRGTFPPADGLLGGTTWWWTSTIDQWRTQEQGPPRPPEV